MLEEGKGPPLFLLHGILASEAVWHRVIPRLTSRHLVIAETSPGHRGRSMPSQRPVGLDCMVDDAEALLDRFGVETAHLAGNSMGGWVALELARRGRARSVCAFSPAGAWELDWPERKRLFKTLAGLRRDTRRSRRLLPTLARSRRFRSWALRHSAVRGEQVERDEFLQIADDAIGCEASEELLASEAQLAPIAPLPCPITLAWAGEDRMLPLERYGRRAQELVPGARFVVLPSVGHVPMLDDPELVARTILGATAGTGRA